MFEAGEADSCFFTYNSMLWLRGREFRSEADGKGVQMW